MSKEIIDDIAFDSGIRDTGNNPRPVPNGDLVLVLGICSIVFCAVYGVVGLACAILALYNYGKVKKMYSANPAAYTPGSFKNASAGKVCAIVGLCLSAVFVFAVLIGLIFAFNPGI
jgi:hypothetical protein